MWIGILLTIGVISGIIAYRESSPKSTVIARLVFAVCFAALLAHVQS